MLKHTVNANHFAIDAMFVAGILSMPGLLYFHFCVKHYSIWNIGEGVLTSLVLTMGVICIAKAFERGGKGGPIICIDSLKVLPPLIIWCFIRSSLPTT